MAKYQVRNLPIIALHKCVLPTVLATRPVLPGFGGAPGSSSAGNVLSPDARDADFRRLMRQVSTLCPCFSDLTGDHRWVALVCDGG